MSEIKQTVYYPFQWPYDAEEQTPKTVSITGSFDDWANMHGLELDTDTLSFKAVVPLTIDTTEKSRIDFKFVVDDEWVTNNSFSVEDDGHGNVNNFIEAADVLAEGKTQKIKVSRKYRRNKKTGERILVSKESVEVDANGVPIRVIESVTYPLVDEFDPEKEDNPEDDGSESSLTENTGEEDIPNLIEVKDDSESI